MWAPSDQVANGLSTLAIGDGGQGDGSNGGVYAAPALGDTMSSASEHGLGSPRTVPQPPSQPQLEGTGGDSGCSHSMPGSGIAGMGGMGGLAGMNRAVGVYTMTGSAGVHSGVGTVIRDWRSASGIATADESEPDEGQPMSIPQAMSEGSCTSINAMSMRQPFASLILYGVKQLEARIRPVLKQAAGPLAIHVADKAEPYGSPLVSTAIALLRQRYSDEAISSLFQLPPNMTQAHGCIVGLVDVENTWHADLFNEIEQAQLSEQAVFPTAGTFVTQLRSPRWLKYPVKLAGYDRIWQAQLPVDSLPDGTEFDENGGILPVSLRARPSYVQLQHAGVPLMEGDEMGLGLLGGDMVRQLQSGESQGEADKKKKKLQKALRQIEELKAKQAQGILLEKTQEGKIAREGELLSKLAQLEADMDATKA